MSDYRHNNGIISCGTLRIARADFDSDPCEEIRQQHLDRLCGNANKSVALTKRGSCVWPNYSQKTIIEALDYLSNHDIPGGGSQNYNSEHLAQLRDEMAEGIANVDKLESDRNRLTKQVRELESMVLDTARYLDNIGRIGAADTLRDKLSDTRKAVGGE